MLAEFIATEDYSLNWYNDDLNNCEAIDAADVILFDSFSYGVPAIKCDLFKNKPMVIIDSYNENQFVSWLTNEKNRGYLLIDNFLEELEEAIGCVLSGGTYVTQKISYTMM